MKFNRRFLSLAILVLALTVVAPAAAHAQEYVRGKFTLTSETHWGPAVLPAGDYQFSFDSSSFPNVVTVRSVTGSSAAMIFPMARSEAVLSDNNRLQLERRGENVYVSSLYLKDLG